MNASEDRLPLRKRQACHPQITQMHEHDEALQSYIDETKTQRGPRKISTGSVATSQKRN